MIRKRVGHAGCNQATIVTTQCAFNCTGCASRNKTSIVMQLLWEGSRRGSRSDDLFGGLSHE